MNLLLETDRGRLAVLPDDHSSSPAVRAWEQPTPASADDLVTLCRAMGVGTGLLRACRRDTYALAQNGVCSR
jgi:hypothetical protein